MSDDNHPETFRDGEFGWVPGALLGGPFDGRRYRMPKLPDGEIPTLMRSPIGDYPDIVAYAVYVRHDEEPVGGYYLYFFDGYEGPDGQRLAHEPEPAELDVARKRV